MSEWVVRLKVDGVGVRYVHFDSWRNERVLVSDLKDASRMSRSNALDVARDLDDEALPVEVDS